MPTVGDIGVDSVGKPFLDRLAESEYDTVACNVDELQVDGPRRGRRDRRRVGPNENRAATLLRDWELLNGAADRGFQPADEPRG